jgi:hypothetical protein
MADMNSSDDGSSPNGVSKVRLLAADIARNLKTPTAEQLNDARSIDRYSSILSLPEELLPAGVGKRIPSAIALDKAMLRQRTRSESHLNRANTQYANQIAQEFSSTAMNSLVGGQMYSTANIAASSAYMNAPAADLVAQQRQISERQLVYQHQAKGMAVGTFSGRTINTNQLGSEAQLKKIEDLHGQFRSDASTSAAIALEMERRKSFGMDPRSQQETSWKYRSQALQNERIQGWQSTGQVNIADAESGGSKSIKLGDITAQLKKEMDALAEDMKKLGAATDAERGAIESKVKARTDAIGTLNEAQAANNEGRGNRIAGLNSIAGTFNAFGAGATNLLVSQPMQQRSNILGAANLANDQYNMYKAARGGDVASQLALSQWGNAEKFGKQVSQGASISVGANQIGAGIQTVAGIDQAAMGIEQMGVQGASGGLLGSEAGTLTLAGVNNAVQGGLGYASSTMDAEKRLSANQAGIAGANLDMQARMALQKVGAEQAQGLRNFYTGMDTVAQGMGTGANTFLSNTTADANLTRMGKAGMSPEQFAAAAQQGVNDIGSTFDTEQIYASRNLERKGFGSTAQNMQRMAALAGAGANQPKEGMEAVLTAAVTAGLDKSKGLDTLVQYTAQMVQASSGAAVGIDTTAAAATMLGAGMNMDMANKEAALRQAATAAEVTRSQTTGVGANWNDMLATSGIRRRTGVSHTEAIIAQQFGDTATLKGLTTEASAAAYWKDKGVTSYEGSALDFNKKMLKQNQIELVRGKTGSGLQTEDAEKYVDIINKAGTDKGAIAALEKAGLLQSFNQTMATSGRTGGGEGIREILGVSKPVNDGGVGKGLTGDGKSDNLKEQLDALRTSGFSQVAEAAASAATQLGGFKTALATLTTFTQQYAKDGTKNEEKYASAAGEMAKAMTTEFKAVAVPFQEATTKYTEASAEMLKAAGLISNGMALVPEAMTSVLDKFKGKK